MLKVSSPRSITGSGTNITLAGVSKAVPVVVRAICESRSYSVGDIIDFVVLFSSKILVEDADIYLVLNTASSPVLLRQVNETAILLRMVIQWRDFSQHLSYLDQFSLRSVSSCALWDIDTRFCAAQNLPQPFSDGDQISSQNIQVSVEDVFINRVRFSILGTILNSSKTSQLSLSLVPVEIKTTREPVPMATT